MFLSAPPRRILAYNDPVDMRKSFHGLVALVQGVLGEDPLSGCWYVFFNRRGNYVKLVTWDRKEAGFSRTEIISLAGPASAGVAYK